MTVSKDFYMDDNLSLPELSPPERLDYANPIALLTPIQVVKPVPFVFGWDYQDERGMVMLKDMGKEDLRDIETALNYFKSKGLAIIIAELHKRKTGSYPVWYASCVSIFMADNDCPYLVYFTI